MSGHSKWSTIKRKKGAKDAERGKVFTKLIKEITTAARQGGGDEIANPRLRSAVAAAKAANMPSQNIDRAVKKGTGELPGVVYEEKSYEGYGPSGVAVMIDALTDNTNRTTAEVRHLLSKYNGNLGETGCVGWMFEKKGLISINLNDSDEDKVMEIAIEAGAEDVATEEDVYEVITAPEDFESVVLALETAGVPVASAEVTKIPQNTVKVSGKQAEQILKLMDALDDNEDVNQVYSNFDIEE